LFKSSKIPPFLNPLHALDHVNESFLGVREWPQIVRVVSAETAEAQVVGDAEGRDARGELGESGEVRFTEGIHAADGQRHAMQCDRHVRTHALEHAERATAATHEILADRFGEIRP
jgi:hypothetical protein